MGASRASDPAATAAALIATQPGLEAAVHDARSRGLEVTVAAVETDLAPPWSSVCLSQVLAALRAFGDVLASEPDGEAVEAGTASSSLLAVVVSQFDRAELQATLGIISGVSGAELAPWASQALPLRQRDRPGSGSGARDSAAAVRLPLGQLLAAEALVADLGREAGRLSATAWRLGARHPRDAGVKALAESVAQVSRAATALGEILQFVRREKAQRLFAPLRRLVREAAAAHGKDAELVIDGEDCEIDPILGEALIAPLTELLRNAVEHGVESPHDRHEAGKHTPAIIRLVIRKTPDGLSLAVEDDGAGIDTASVRAAAGRSRAISRDDALGIAESDAVRLVLQAGVSTADDEGGGQRRGEGFPTVRDAIEAFGGTIAIESKVGGGTKVTLEVPPSVSVASASVRPDERQSA
jgi:two-component system chemotaxis sensor kinase CheA